jgi:hypothetical protein
LCEKSDLHVYLQFLDKAKAGIPINNIVFQKPSLFYRSDASGLGIGGYNISTGSAWHLEIPVHLRLRASFNSLEFIASIITIWIDILNNEILPEAIVIVPLPQVGLENPTFLMTMIQSFLTA